MKLEDVCVSVSIYDRATGETIAYAAEHVGTLVDDSVTISASNLAYGLIEEAWGHIEDEDA